MRSLSGVVESRFLPGPLLNSISGLYYDWRRCNQLPHSENFPISEPQEPTCCPPPPTFHLPCGPIWFLYLYVYVLIGCLSPVEFKRCLVCSHVPGAWKNAQPVWTSFDQSENAFRHVAWITISRVEFTFTYRCRPCFCNGWEPGCWQADRTSCRKGSWANWRKWFGKEGECSRHVDLHKQIKDRT